MIARRSWSLGVLSVGLLLILTGCPSLIANVVSPSQSIQQAIDQAQPGDVIRFMGTHQENVTIDKDGLSLIGDGPDAKIEGTLTITGDRVKTENFIVDGDVMLDGDSGEFQDMQITGVLDTPSGSFEDGMFTNFAVGGWGFNVGGFGVHDVDSQSTVTLNGTFSCADIVQPSESIQTAIDNTASGAKNRRICVAPSTRSVATSNPNGPPLVVDKSVNLLALVSRETVLNVNSGLPSEIVRVTHSNVRIEGFKLSTDNLGTTGVRVFSTASDVVLTDLAIQETETAIDLISPKNFTLRNSLLSNNQYGITLSSASNVTIKGNTIRNHTTGIRVTGESTGTMTLTISRNNIISNGTGLRYNHFGIQALIMAEDNWWGAASGPNDSQGNGESNPLNGAPGNCAGNPASSFNSAGTGNQVVDTANSPVDYCPWATSSLSQ